MKPKKGRKNLRAYSLDALLILLPGILWAGAFGKVYGNEPYLPEAVSFRTLCLKILVSAGVLYFLGYLGIQALFLRRSGRTVGRMASEGGRRGLQDLMNGLSDEDWGWWPFLFLRPPRNRAMDNAVLLKITLSFGTVLGLAVYFPFTVLGLAGASLRTFAILMASVWALFFILYKVSFARYWNKRARRL